MIDEIINHCAKELGIKDTIIALEEEDDVGATCAYDREDKVITITLNFLKSDFEFLLLMVCHEMVHVRDFLNGSLVEKSARLTEWKGELISHSDHIYYALPWEKEAFGLEEKLFGGYVKGLI